MAARLQARLHGHTYDPTRETFVFGKADLSAVAQRAKAEGATTPETLRQKDRDGYELLESEAAIAGSAEGVTCDSGENSQVP